ncbi:hypothetical protein SCLCIDRAFT_44408, partial [Scleroderma citrinum Foug A]
STRNCHIERLWVEVGSQYARRWQWNCHPISGSDTNNKSPKDLRLLGQMCFGVYHEDGDQIEEEYDDEVADVIASQQHEYINHAAISVPIHRNPFDHNEAEVTFFMGLCEVVIQDVTPDGFGLTPVEWLLDEYPLFETI